MDTPHSKQALERIGVIRCGIETFSKARFYSRSFCNSYTRISLEDTFGRRQYKVPNR